MINFSDDCLWGKMFKIKRQWVKKRLFSGKVCPGVFLITNPTNPNNSFDIFDAKLLIFSYYKNRDITVFAVGKNRDEAEELLLKLIEKKYAGS